MGMRNFVDEHLIKRHIEARRGQVGEPADFLSYYIREIERSRKTEDESPELNGEWLG